MKRTLLQRGAIIAACAAAFVLGGCGDTEFDSRTDTVYSLETPQVEAKAYPGVNIVSWKPVPGAQSYNVTVYEEGMATFAKTENQPKNTTYYTDDDLENGKNYTYCVEAVSSSDPASITYKAVYATNSKGEASVRAIVPPADTEALALPAYEGGYDGKTTKTVSDNDKKWIVATNNINAFLNGDNIIVEFPVKAYLTYDVCYYKNRGEIPEDAITLQKGDDDKSFVNNVMGKVTFAHSKTGGDSYEIVVVAKSRGKNFKSSKEILSDKKVTIKKLNVTDAEDISAEYVLKGDKFATGADSKVRVSFKPGYQKDNGYNVPTDWYTVYHRVKGTSTNTKVPGTVSIDEVGNYYIEDETDLTKDYEYTVVVCHDNEYGTASSPVSISNRGKEQDDWNTVTAPAITTVEYVLDDNKFVEGASKLIRVVFTPAKDNGEYLPIDSHKVYRQAEGENVWTLLTATIKDGTTTNGTTTNGTTTTKYYVEETLSDVEKGYTYKVVATAGTKYTESATNNDTCKADAESKKYITGITITNSPNKSTNKVTWTVKYIGKAKLSAKYLIVSSDRNTSVLANEVLENGKEVNLSQKLDADDKPIEGEYTVVVTDSTFTGTAKAFLAVKADLDGYKTTNVLSSEAK